jgi:hypothetical protein
MSLSLVEPFGGTDKPATLPPYAGVSRPARPAATGCSVYPVSDTAFDDFVWKRN